MGEGELASARRMGYFTTIAYETTMAVWALYGASHAISGARNAALRRPDALAYALVHRMDTPAYVLVQRIIPTRPTYYKELITRSGKLVIITIGIKGVEEGDRKLRFMGGYATDFLDYGLVTQEYIMEQQHACLLNRSEIYKRILYWQNLLNQLCPGYALSKEDVLRLQGRVGPKSR